MHRDGQNSGKYYASRWASIKIHIIFNKYLIRARMKSLGGQICFTIIPDSLIDSIVETINHIHCENTSQRIFEQFFFSVTLCGSHHLHRVGIFAQSSEKSHIFDRKIHTIDMLLLLFLDRIQHVA